MSQLIFKLSLMDKEIITIYTQNLCTTGPQRFFSGAEIWPNSHWNLGDFFSPNLHFFLFFFLRLEFSFSQHTQMLHGDILL